MQNTATDTDVKVHPTTKRPIMYYTHVQPFLPKIREWIEQGITDYCIAENLGISRRSYEEYKKKYPELQEIYKRTEAKLVSVVVNALFKKACGFRERVQRMTKNGEIVEYEEYFPPDTTAAIFFLTNRDPDHWKHRNALTSLHLQQNNQYNIEIAEKRIQELLNEIRCLEESPENPEIQD